MKTRYFVTALIVMVLLAVAALVRGGDTVNPPPCPCTDTVYIVDTVYVSIDFKAAAREAARITNDQMGGEPLKSINLKEK